MTRRSLLPFLLLFCFTAQTASAACEFDIEVSDSLAFSVEEMTAEADCGSVTVNLSHTGRLPAAAMGHNWVLTRPEDFQPVAKAGGQAGLEADYLPPEDERVIAATRILGGGEQDSIEFSLEGLEPGDYTFFCSFPGHWSVMKGTFRIP